MPRFAKCRGRVERPLGHHPGGDDADIAPVAEALRLADLERIGRRIEHHRHLAAQQPHVDRPGIGGDGGRRLGDVGGVARVDDDEPRDHPHQRQILDRLMRPAIAGGQAGQPGDDLHVELAMGDGDGDEVEGAPRGEDAIGGGEGDLARPGETGGDGDEVLLRHADIEEAVGKGVAERQDVGVLAEVGGEADDLRPGMPGRDQSLAEGRLDAGAARGRRLVLPHGKRT